VTGGGVVGTVLVGAGLLSTVLPAKLPDVSPVALVSLLALSAGMLLLSGKLVPSRTVARTESQYRERIAELIEERNTWRDAYLEATRQKGLVIETVAHRSAETTGEQPSIPRGLRGDG
jgi:hypothetical protein